MNEQDRIVAYDLLTKVFSEFFKQMRQKSFCPPLPYGHNSLKEEIWEHDWDELRNPVLNLIEEAFKELMEGTS